MQNDKFGSKIKKKQKGAKNGSTTTLKLLCAKKPSKKHLILEKGEQFENGQNRPRCMGYSPSKMLSLGQKLKIPKRCGKRLYDRIKVVVRKKPLKKKDKILKKREQFENGQNRPRCMGYSPCKMISLGQKLRINIKVRKTVVRPH